MNFHLFFQCRWYTHDEEVRENARMLYTRFKYTILKADSYKVSTGDFWVLVQGLNTENDIWQWAI